MPITTGQLFAEDFTPLWLQIKREFIAQSYLDNIQVVTDYKWRKMAEAKNSHIAKKYAKTNQKKPLAVGTLMD